MSLHADALNVLGEWDAPDVEQQRLRDRYIAHLLEQPRGMWRDCRPDHLTASVFVINADATHALLTLHAKAQVWFQFGGHCEEHDATLRAAALREGTEESGISGLAISSEPLQLNEHEVPFCGPSGDTHHLDVRYVAQAPSSAAYALSEESLDLKWWPLDALPTDEASLHELGQLAVAYFN